MTRKKFALTSMPMLSFGTAVGSAANPTLGVANATNPSKLRLRSLIST
jgi:hypothetical protein